MALLKDKIKNLSNKPGVYIFKNRDGKIIYIGKALSLKHRVKSYFQNKHQDPKINELVPNIADIDHLIVNSEFEALILEAKLIKQYQPKYNSAQKDSKSYLYIVIGKEFPNRIFTARWTELNQKFDSWYGPFFSSTDAKRILRFIRHIFPFRSCKRLPKVPCLYKDMRLCSAPCVIPDESYAKTIQKIKMILSGRIKNLLKALEKEMRQSSKNLDFEKAQLIKAQIDSLNFLLQGWRTVPKEKKEISKTFLELRKILVKYQGFDPMSLNKIEGFDVSNLGTEIIVGSMAVFTDGEPDSSLYRRFNLKFNMLSQDDPEGIKNIIRRRLNHPEWVYPQLILIDGGKTQVSAAFDALKEKGLVGKISLLGLTKEDETIVIPKIEKEICGWKQLRLSRHSPELQLLQQVRDEAHRFAQNYYKFKHKKSFLPPSLPSK